MTQYYLNGFLSWDEYFNLTMRRLALLRWKIGNDTTQTPSLAPLDNASWDVTQRKENG